MGLNFIRTVILYASVITAMRIMGKRTIGEMHPTELVVSIMISDLATVPMQSESTPLLNGLVPIFTLVVLELVFAFLILKSRIIRRILVGHSCHVVKDGKLVYNSMSQLRVTVDDIEEQIRIAGYTSLKDIREVVIETNGQVSVIPKSDKPTPYIIIADGKLRKKDMKNADMNKTEVKKYLKEHGVDIRDVLYMSGYSSKVIHFQKKGENNA